jgi:hypothetical protein
VHAVALTGLLSAGSCTSLGCPYCFTNNRGRLNDCLWQKPRQAAATLRQSPRFCPHAAHQPSTLPPGMLSLSLLLSLATAYVRDICLCKSGICSSHTRTQYLRCPPLLRLCPCAIDPVDKHAQQLGGTLQGVKLQENSHRL